MRVVERADGGLALVLNLLAVLQQGEASLVGIAFLALVEPETAIRFFCTVVPSVAPPFCAASAASTIASYVSAVYVKSVTLALKDLTFFWNSSVGWAPGMVPGGALEQARVEVGGMVDGVAVGHVQLVGVEALGGELLDERHGLVEGDDERRVGVGGLDGRDHR